LAERIFSLETFDFLLVLKKPKDVLLFGAKTGRFSVIEI